MGAAVLQRAEEIEHLMGLIKHEANQDRPALRGKISIGMPPAAALRIRPTLGAADGAGASPYPLHLRDGVSSLIHEWVIEKRIDLGLAYNATPIDAAWRMCRCCVSAPSSSGRPMRVR